MNLESHLKGHFLNLYHMALSDSEIETTELEMLYRIGEEKGVSKTDIDEIIIKPDKIKFEPPETVIAKIESLYDFARIAWADGKIDENEERVMIMLCSKFGFEKDNISTIVQFLLDEVNKGTTKSEIFKIVNENL